MILLYHRIADLADDPLSLAVTPARFRAQMEVLRSLAPVVSFEDLARPATAPRVLITFDDGYVDNARCAAPILEDLALPATFFVTSAPFTGATQEFWWDRLAHLLLEAPDPRRASIELPLPGGRRVVADLRSAAARRRTFLLCNEVLVYEPPAVQESVLAAIAAQVGGDPASCAEHGRLGAAELRRLHDGGLITIGAHTRDHFCLAALDHETARDQIAGVRDDLAAILGAPPEVLAYPYGGSRLVDERHEQIAAAAGYRWACTTHRGVWRGSGSPHALPRLLVPDVDATAFRAILEPVLV